MILEIVGYDSYVGPASWKITLSIMAKVGLLAELLWDSGINDDASTFLVFKLACFVDIIYFFGKNKLH